MQFPISLSCYVGQKVSPLIQKVCVCEGNIKAEQQVFGSSKIFKENQESFPFFPTITQGKNPKSIFIPSVCLY